MTALPSAFCTRAENIASMPRLSVTEANTATRMAGTTAMMLNHVTRRTCRRAPARPDLRCAHSRTSRQAINAPKVRLKLRLISSSSTNPARVGV